MTTITKAVFPVAGLGTRFLPATKASPKEMLPIVDKPLIQYAVEEAIEAGITEMIFVTGRSKRAIEDHFDKAYELETELEARGRTHMLELLRNMLPKNVSCIYLRQAEALGLGHAVLCAKPIVKDEPFAVILADDLIDAKPGALTQMVALFQEHQASVIATEVVVPAETSHYGRWATISAFLLNTRVINKSRGEAFFSNHPAGLNAVFADGHVAFITEAIAPKALRATSSKRRIILDWILSRLNPSIGGSRLSV
jgi:prepilin-type processing-associated H-X9-DG protein